MDLIPMNPKFGNSGIHGMINHGHQAIRFMWPDRESRDQELTYHPPDSDPDSDSESNVRSAEFSSWLTAWFTILWSLGWFLIMQSSYARLSWLQSLPFPFHVMLLQANVSESPNLLCDTIYLSSSHRLSSTVKYSDVSIILMEVTDRE